MQNENNWQIAGKIEIKHKNVTCNTNLSPVSDKDIYVSNEKSNDANKQRNVVSIWKK